MKVFNRSVVVAVAVIVISFVIGGSGVGVVSVSAAAAAAAAACVTLVIQGREAGSTDTPNLDAHKEVGAHEHPQQQRHLPQT